MTAHTPAAMPLLTAWTLAALLLSTPLTGSERSRVLAGEVLVTTAVASPADRGPKSVHAAIRIAAPPGRVFAVMTSCREALQFVRRLESCKVLASAADGSYQLIEQEVNLRWYLPRIRFVFRAAYDPPREVRITNVSGGLREHEGRWTLEPLDGGAATLVEYRVRVVPHYPVPQWLILATLKRDLPETLRALADRCTGRHDAGG